MQLTVYSKNTASSGGEPYLSGASSMPPSSNMLNQKGSNAQRKINREPFVTIDDLTHQAQGLLNGLQKLGTYKHPLQVRRGIPLVGKGVMTTMKERKGREESKAGKESQEKMESQQIKGSGRTYFLDVAKTSQDKPYLRITESRKGEGDKFKRSSIHVFPEDAKKFAKAVKKMTGKLE